MVPLAVRKIDAGQEFQPSTSQTNRGRSRTTSDHIRRDSNEQWISRLLLKTLMTFLRERGHQKDWGEADHTECCEKHHAPVTTRGMTQLQTFRTKLEVVHDMPSSRR